MFSGPPTCYSDVDTTTPTQSPSDEMGRVAVTFLSSFFIGHSKMLSIAAIIITGGDGPLSERLSTVEVLAVDGSFLCSLPDLPNDRRVHTQSGLIVCGGTSNVTEKSCVTFSSGIWSQSHTLIHDRGLHSAWYSPAGIMLMGGTNRYDRESIYTTEIIGNDDVSHNSYTLRYGLW